MFIALTEITTCQPQLQAIGSLILESKGDILLTDGLLLCPSSASLRQIATIEHKGSIDIGAQGVTISYKAPEVIRSHQLQTVHMRLIGIFKRRHRELLGLPILI